MVACERPLPHALVTIDASRVADWSLSMRRLLRRIGRCEASHTEHTKSVVTRAPQHGFDPFYLHWKASVKGCQGLLVS
jgi:hypothetical protein